MSRVAYVNGRYIRHAEAGVSIDDRAFLFSDGIYEVIEVLDGVLFDERGHLDRLARSARELRLKLPMGEAALKFVLREVVARNRVRFGHVYLQVTRGSARREHYFPARRHASEPRRHRPARTIRPRATPRRGKASM